MLHSLDLATGKKLWSVDTRQKFGSAKGFFGAACSPLVDAGIVLMNVGGPKGAGIVAFDVQSGNVRWTATSDEAGYSAPVAATINGAKHALFFTRKGLTDIDPASGKVRFQFPWRSRSQASVNAAAPLVIGNLVFLSASYETGATLLRLEADQAKQVWASDDALSNHYATSVYKDGYLYGYHGRQEFGPKFARDRTEDGQGAVERRWIRGRHRYPGGRSARAASGKRRAGDRTRDAERIPGRDKVAALTGEGPRLSSSGRWPPLRS